jgi:TRAP-type C4-dicarboxylate transport system permease small subunit
VETVTQTDRVEELRAEVAQMRLRDPATSRDRALLVLGAVLMVGGIGVAIYGYALSHSTSDQRQQIDALIVALVGVTVSIAGAALFLRYSFAQFLRFWLARLTYEQHAQTDRVVDAIKSGPPTA